MYALDWALATHGDTCTSENGKRRIGDCRSDELHLRNRVNWRQLPAAGGNQTASQRNLGQVGPAILPLFAHESQFSDPDKPAALVLRPTLARHQIRILGQVLSA